MNQRKRLSQSLAVGGALLIVGALSYGGGVAIASPGPAGLSPAANKATTTSATTGRIRPTGSPAPKNPTSRSGSGVTPGPSATGSGSHPPGSTPAATSSPAPTPATASSPAPSPSAVVPGVPIPVIAPDLRQTQGTTNSTADP